MSTILPLEHKTDVKVLIAKIIGNPPYIIRIRVSHDHPIVGIYYTVIVGIYITRITRHLISIQWNSIGNILLTENTILLHNKNTIHGCSYPQNTVFNIKGRRNQNLLLITD